jgi:hypothetical protein
MKLNIEFEKPFFDDIEPDIKTANDLIIQVLSDTTGEMQCTSRYNHNDISRCARQLISGGFLRGTIIDYNTCVWSKTTRKGRYLLELLKNTIYSE